MSKFKFKTHYDCYVPTEGTINTEPSKTDVSLQEEVDIYKVIEKYNATGLVPKTRNEEPMYLDCRGITGLTLDEAIRQREQMEEYFLQMPSKVRKIFGDNVDEYVTKYRNGEFAKFIETGSLTEEQVRILTEDELAKDQAKFEKMAKEQQLYTLEQAKAELTKENTNVEN